MSDQTYATPVPQSSPPQRDYSAFDADLTGQAFNFQLFARLLRWLRPYRLTVAFSLLFILLAAGLAVMLPVVTGLVVIDNILRPESVSGEEPDFGMTELTYLISDVSGYTPRLYPLSGHGNRTGGHHVSPQDHPGQQCAQGPA